MLCAATSFTYAQEKENTNKWTSSRADGHAPISIMADHVHHKGEFMISYRYMTMDMRGLGQGSKNTSVSTAHANYMVAPLDMTMNMHMLGGMYAPSNKVTLMVMANYLEKDMNLQMRSGNIFQTSTRGLGDVSVAALYALFNKNKQAMHAQIGLSIPTGSIEEKGVLPVSAGNAVQLPYPMQTGTGSFGTKLGLTYLRQSNKFSWGHQLTGMINLNDNSQDYKFGNRYSINNWFAANTGNNISFSLRLEGLIINKINGASSALNPMMVTTADTANSGGTFINSGFGLNYLVANGELKGLRFATEISTPVYQNLNGIQLKQNYNLTFGLQYAFH